MKVLGIDPGINGALVVLENGVPIEWMMMPTYQAGSHKRVNCLALGRWIEAREVDKAYVENVHAMPGQGVVSMFSFGHACGSLMGVLGAYRIPTETVTPQQWKKRAGIINKDKDASRSKAIQLFPYWDELDAKIKGQAYADAALIAFFGDKDDK